MAEEDHAPIPLVDANAPVIVGDTDTATPSLASFAEDTPAATSMLAKVELDHPGSDAGFPVSAPVPADADTQTDADTVNSHNHVNLTHKDAPVMDAAHEQDKSRDAGDQDARPDHEAHTQASDALEEATGPEDSTVPPVSGHAHAAATEDEETAPDPPVEEASKPFEEAHAIDVVKSAPELAVELEGPTPVEEETEVDKPNAESAQSTLDDADAQSAIAEQSTELLVLIDPEAALTHAEPLAELATTLASAEHEDVEPPRTVDFKAPANESQLEDAPHAGAAPLAEEPAPAEEAHEDVSVHEAPALESVPHAEEPETTAHAPVEPEAATDTPAELEAVADASTQPEVTADAFDEPEAAVGAIIEPETTEDTPFETTPVEFSPSQPEAVEDTPAEPELAEASPTDPAGKIVTHVDDPAPVPDVEGDILGDDAAPAAHVDSAEPEAEVSVDVAHAPIETAPKPEEATQEPESPAPTLDDDPAAEPASEAAVLEPEAAAEPVVQDVAHESVDSATSLAETAAEPVEAHPEPEHSSLVLEEDIVAEPTTEIEAAPEDETTPGPQAASELEAAPESETLPESEATPEPHAAEEPETGPEPEVAAEPEFAAEPEVATEPEVAAEQDVSTEPAAASASEDATAPITLEEPSELLVLADSDSALTHAAPISAPVTEDQPSLTRLESTPAASGAELLKGTEIAAIAAIDVVPLADTAADAPVSTEEPIGGHLDDLDEPGEAAISQASSLLDTPASSGWASDAPTPVERDEVVLAPSDFLVAETVAAFDAQKAGADDHLHLDTPAEETEPVLHESGPNQDIAENAPTTLEPEPEDDVQHAVHVLGEVTTPALELEDAPTPASTSDEPLLSLDTLHSAPAINVSDETGAITPLQEVTPVTEVNDEESERPNRPWTPSYSVRSQGPGAPGAEEEEPATTEEAEMSAARLESPAALDTTAQPETDRSPSRPWTPSYSVTNQGTVTAEDIEERGAVAIVAADLVTEPVPGTTSEDTAPAPIQVQDDLDIADPEPEVEDVVAEDTTEPVTATSVEEEVAPIIDTRVEQAVEPALESDHDVLEDEEPAPAFGSEDTAPTSEILDLVEPGVAESSTVPPSTAEVAHSDHGEEALLSEDTALTSNQVEPEVAENSAVPLLAANEDVPMVPTLAIDGEPHQDDAVSHAEAEQPRSASRPWTPSYSVTNQGPDTAEAERELASAEEEEDFIPPPPLPSLKRSLSTSSLNVPITPAEQDEERPRSPWTPSYSISNQGLADLVDEPAAGTTSEDTAPAPTGSAPIDEDITDPVAEPIQAAVEEPTHPSTTGPEIVVDDQAVLPIGTEPEAAAERLTSRPWTPSYSVTSQGPAEHSGPEPDVDRDPVDPSAAEEQGASTVEPIAQEAMETAAAAATLSTPAEAERPPSRPWTPSYSVTNQAPGQATVEPASKEDSQGLEEPTDEKTAAQALAAPTESDQPPSRPWTPSYSVTSQRPTEEAAAEPAAETSEEPIMAGHEAAVDEQTLTAPAEGDRPPSRPWTPSYSVTNQRPTEEAAAAPKVKTSEEPATTGYEVLVEQPIDQTLATPAEGDHPPSRPWTPSYSVTNQRPEEQASKLDQDADQVVTAQPEEATAQEPEAHTLAVAEEIERPPSRPWTPSYSTTSQGPSDAHAAEPAVPVPEEAHSEPEPVQTLAASTDETRPPSRPWTPSYSVTSQVPATPSQDEAKEPSTAPALQVSTEELAAAHEAAAQNDAEVKAPLTPQIQINDGPEPAHEQQPEEDSKASWTQSYSVTSQPGSPRQEQAELLAEGAHEQQLEEDSKPSWAQSYSVTSQPGSPRQERAEISEEEPAQEIAEVEQSSSEVAGGAQPETSLEAEAPPQRPWTPSYSVMSQGPGTPGADADVNEPTVEAAGEPQESSTATEFPATQAGTEKPELTPLAAVDTSDKASDRSRLDSIASGRFFPGGWFSSTPTTHDVEEEEEEEEEAVPDNADAEEVGQTPTKEHRRRCIIM